MSPTMKTLHTRNKEESIALTALLNSSLFYWWFILASDCRVLNNREIDNFPVNLKVLAEKSSSSLVPIHKELMKNYCCNSVRKSSRRKATGQVVVQDEFRPAHAKPIMDKIDAILAEYYGFTDEELDYITNYDIKYRTGICD